MRYETTVQSTGRGEGIKARALSLALESISSKWYSKFCQHTSEAIMQRMLAHEIWQRVSNGKEKLWLSILEGSSISSAKFRIFRSQL